MSSTPTHGSVCRRRRQARQPRIDHYCIKVEPFDRDAVAARLREIGLRVLPSPDEPEVLRFADNYEIIVELKPV